MATEFSDRGVLEIAEHEGIVLGPYLDSVKVWTVWVGHTRAAGSPDPSQMKREDTRGWSDERVTEELLLALVQFDTDLAKYEDRVRRAIKVSLKQYQFDSLGSFDFNTGGIYKAKLTADINRGDMSGAGFMGWLKPKEITGRRKAEMNLFLTGNYDANGDDIPIYDTLGDGRIKFRMSIDGSKLAALMGKAGSPRTVAAGPKKSGLLDLILALLKKLMGSK